MDFKYSEITLWTHNKFVKKNATTTNSPLDFKILEFSENKLICPRHNLRKYLEITDTLCQDINISRPHQLFIYMDCSPITKYQLRAFIRNIVARADPFSLNQFTSFHNVRHVASTMLDDRGFTIRQILEQMQWKS